MPNNNKPNDALLLDLLTDGRRTRRRATASWLRNPEALYGFAKSA